MNIEIDFVSANDALALKNLCESKQIKIKYYSKSNKMDRGEKGNSYSTKRRDS